MPKSRTERHGKTKIGIEVAHVTRESDTTFKVKGQGHQAALLTAALTRQAAAAVRVGTNVFGVGSYCYVGVCSVALRHPRREERAGAYCVATRTACSIPQQQVGVAECRVEGDLRSIYAAFPARSSTFPPRSSTRFFRAVGMLWFLTLMFRLEDVSVLTTSKTAIS